MLLYLKFFRAITFTLSDALYVFLFSVILFEKYIDEGTINGWGEKIETRLIEFSPKKEIIKSQENEFWGYSKAKPGDERTDYGVRLLRLGLFGF